MLAALAELPNSLTAEKRENTRDEYKYHFCASLWYECTYFYVVLQKNPEPASPILQHHQKPLHALFNSPRMYPSIHVYA
jgi:hypothetical protein